MTQEKLSEALETEATRAQLQHMKAFLVGEDPLSIVGSRPDHSDQVLNLGSRCDKL